MDDLISKLRAALGDRGVLAGDDARDAAAQTWSRLGVPLGILRPASTAEVSAALKIAHAAGAAVVPWGGRTGLVDGAQAEGALALSLERMTAIEEIDVEASTLTVQAGCPLQTACEAVEARHLLLPLDLGSRGSATIGGTISTNAGGNRVLRYGMMRDMVLGLEAVLADGTVVTALNGLIKNNAGYDIKQLFIGSEGTLGVVTRAVLRLRPQALSQDVALLGVERFDDLPRLLRHLERRLGGTLSAFEVMWKSFHDLVTTEPAKGRPLLSGDYPYYVLVETLGADPAADAERLEAALAEAAELDLIADAVFARSETQAKAIWALRDDVAQVARDGPILTFDVSLKISAMETYVAELEAALQTRCPGTRLVVFGHLGDGNLHLIVSLRDRDARAAIEEIVYGLVRAQQGSISAEHGIGLQKRDYLGWTRNPAEIAVMRTLKTALDPKNILNPGKVLAG
ncbi:FAD-binding oxidoreductase [Phenylobacterium aquaticum]|uniref:FAD-binding oxidoreductase n=1 Tax=Phenylobacterium aquaticum TaxID=1763816 RepID=UPI001F5CBCD5|nr:FAD-binding oxidoreductase [Phenylobacterium aquaticum]MCI3132146.1 FAD-binding oxidoreductase [Phenylobacterium aquaticum]